MKTELVAGAYNITLENGDTIWCPPAFVAKVECKPFEVFPWTITRPYWTSGSKCEQNKSGPELKDEEIKELGMGECGTCLT